MIGYTNASSGVSYGEYEDLIGLMTRCDEITFLAGLDKWITGNLQTNYSTSVVPATSGVNPVTVDFTIFLQLVLNKAGEYNFVYTSNNWTLSRTTITLADYGIAVVSGTPVEGDNILVVVRRNGPFVQEVQLTRIQSTNTPTISIIVPDIIPGYFTKDMFNANVSITWSTFATHVNNKSDVYVFEYSNNSWKLQGAAVSLVDFGITVTGTPIEGDNFSVHYSISEYLEAYSFITKVETIQDQDIGYIRATCYLNEPLMNIVVGVKGV